MADIKSEMADMLNSFKEIFSMGWNDIKVDLMHLGNKVQIFQR